MGFSIFPKKCNQKNFEKLGFKFYETIDDLLIVCKLPYGWKKEASEDSYSTVCTDLIDNNGCKRGWMTCTITPEEQIATAHLIPRYLYGSRPVNGWTGEMITKDTLFEAVVTDRKTGKVLWSSKTSAWGDIEQHAKDNTQARLWLEEHYPDCKDCLTYWDQ